MPDNDDTLLGRDWTAEPAPLWTPQGRVKYLVSWVNKEGVPGGQTAKDAAEANRLFEHLVKQENILVEAREIGRICEYKGMKLYYKNTALIPTANENPDAK